MRASPPAPTTRHLFILSAFRKGSPAPSSAGLAKIPPRGIEARAQQLATKETIAPIGAHLERRKGRSWGESCRRFNDPLPGQKGFV